MSNLDTIEGAVKQLSGNELREFRAWFTRFDSKNWDSQLEQDAKLGKLDAIAKEAVAEYGKLAS